MAGSARLMKRYGWLS